MSPLSSLRLVRTGLWAGATGRCSRLSGVIAWSLKRWAEARCGSDPRRVVCNFDCVSVIMAEWP